MDEVTLLSHVRRRIGDPGPDQVTDRDLLLYVEPAFEWLAGELQYNVRTVEQAITLAADVYTYPLPEDCARIIWLEYAGQRLTPASVPQWVRDGDAWRGAASGTPQEYAVQARSLILMPPPSSDTVSATPFLPLSYIAFAGDLDPAGQPLLVNADLWCVVHRAARDWLADNPGGDDATLKARAGRQQANATSLGEFLAQAHRRRELPVTTRTKRFKIGGRRNWAAR